MCDLSVAPSGRPDFRHFGNKSAIHPTTTPWIFESRRSSSPPEMSPPNCIQEDMGEQPNPKGASHGRANRGSAILRNALMRILNSKRREKNQIVEITESKISTKEQVLTKNKR